MTSIRLLIVGVAAAFVLAGCTGVDPSPTSTQSAGDLTPAPTPTQSRETGLTQPAQVFGGDCGALFRAEDLSRVLGTTMALAPASQWDARSVALEVHGGLRCLWTGTDAAVWAAALPEGAVTYSSAEGCGTAFETQVPLCPLESIAGGIRLSGAVAPQHGDGRTEQAALVALFSQQAASYVAVPTPIPAVGAWVYPLDCAGVADAADLSAVPGLGGDAKGTWTSAIEGTYSSMAEAQLWGNYSPVCEIYEPGVNRLTVDFEAYGGARWEETELAAGASPLAADGLDFVGATPLPDGRFAIDVFEGPNWLHFTVGSTSIAGPIAIALVAALDTTAVR